MTKALNQRQKLKRLWCRRGLLSLGFFCLISVAVVRVPIVLEQLFHYQQTQAKRQLFERLSYLQMRVLELELELASLRQLKWVEEELEQSLGVKAEPQSFSRSFERLRFREELQKQLQKQLQKLVKEQLQEQLQEQLREQLQEQLQLREQLREQLQLRQQLREQLQKQLQLREQLQKQEQKLKQLQKQELEQKQLQKQLREQLQLRQQLREQLREREQRQKQELKQLLLPLQEREQRQKQELKQLLLPLQEQVSALGRRMTYEFIGLGVAAFGGLVLLLLLVLQRDRTGVPLTGHLVLILPEECVAELAALHQRLRKQQHPRWYVRFRMVQEVLELMFGVYVQVNLDNWGLPGWSNRIDDE